MNDHYPWKRNLLKVIAPVALVVVVFGWLEYVTYTQYASHRFYLADIGLLDVTLVNTLRGEFMKAPTLGWNYLGVHFRVFLFFVPPLYLVVNHIMTLATVHNIALVGAALPLYFFACSRTHIRWLSLAIAFAYLFNHFTLSLHMAVHPESMIMVGFFTMYMAAQRRMVWVYIPALLWTLTIREEIGIFTCFYGCYLAFIAPQRCKHLGLITIAISLSWVVIAFGIMALIRPEGGWKGGVPAIERYSSLGSNWGEVIGYVVTTPWFVLYRIVSRPVLYLALLSVAMLPLLHPRSAWLLFPPALFMLTSDFQPMNRLLYYYSYPFIPFIWLSTVEATAFLVNHPKWKTTRYPIAVLLVFTGIIAFYLPTRTDNYTVRPFTITAHHRILRPFLRSHIPDGARVAAQYEIFCQVPHEYRTVPLWIENLDDIDYAVIDTTRPSADLTTNQRRHLIDTLTHPPFTIIARKDRYIIFNRAPPPPGT